METRPLGGETVMIGIWHDAAKSFEKICGKSLLTRGDVKSFDDVEKIIQNINQGKRVDSPEQKGDWDEVKRVGLMSLKWLKVIVGLASQASSLGLVPGGVADITSNALCFVFDIPESIKRYHDAINEVFGKISTALSQFSIYQSMRNLDGDELGPLVPEIKSVMESFVKLCAHVVKYRQGTRWYRFKGNFKSVFEGDVELNEEISKFEQALQRTHSIEGTITLAMVEQARDGTMQVLENLIVFSKSFEETQKQWQTYKVDSDRRKSLEKIRDNLDVPPTVLLDTRSTQTCTNIYVKRCENTVSWITKHPKYCAWTGPEDEETSRVLLVLGPASSGKTTATAVITKHLEGKQDRTYVAHYFFPASAKTSEGDKDTVRSALKYMAFQIARVDDSVRNALSKACDAGPTALKGSGSLDDIWAELKIGVNGRGARYYLIFDGIENLREKQSRMLLSWVFSSNQGEGIAGRARILLSGTAEMFANIPGAKSASRIQMDHHNSQDMRDVIEESLNTRGLLQDTKPGSDRYKAREDIIEKLPQNVNGSYLLLKFAMDKISRTLSTRTAAQELHRILTESVNSHELAINELQRSLSAEDVGELNELLKWILYSEERLKVEQLEAAMFLYSSVDSPLASLEYIITNKYSAILKLEDGYVYAQDDVASYLKKRTNDSAKALQSPERPTISMTIKIDNIDQELCGHFFWDLAQQTIRQNFKSFNFDTASNTLDTSRHTIAVDEFNAHHTIVTRAFDYLDQQSTVQTQHIGPHLVFWLPYHLDRLRQLENEDKGTLMPSEKLRLGRNLYELFKNRETFARHLESFKPSYWTAKEMGQVKVWLMDSGIVRKLEPKWLNEIQRAVNPVRGFLKELAGTVLEGLLRDRSWDVSYAYAWIKEFMEADTQGLPETRNANTDDASSSSSSSSEIDWDQMSRWCQEYLGLPDSELNSLWYERLAEVASSQEGSEADTILRLYRKAVDQGSPSWLCYRGIGQTYFRLGETSEAIKQVELALSEANHNGATPMDVASLHLLLGEYAHEADDAQKAADHYSQACLSEDKDQVRRGKFGQLKSTFNLADTEVKRDFLRGLLAEGNGEVAMVDMLRMTARDEDCDAIVSQMFAVSMGDVDLSRAIVQAMARATTNEVSMENRTSGSLSEIRFPEDESRGVLLYYLGIAAYKYNQVSTEGTEPISEAVRLWRECREQLSDVGGSNASVVQETATAELAKHYFQIMMDGNHLKKVDALSKLDDGDSDLRADPPALLGTLYALNGDQKSSRATLKSRMRNALQDLTDDIADNDPVGLYDMFCVLANSGDLKNATVAIALQGQPDLVTEALSLDDGDIFDCDDADKERVLETITTMSEEIVLAVKEQVPDTSQQIPRIKVANDIIESRLATQEMNSGGAEDSGEGYRTDPVPATTLVAQGHLRDSLSDLQLWHTPELDEGRLQRVLSCDGFLPDGRRCNLDFGFEQDFFHCLYCSKIDFCGDCLERLRNPKDAVRIIACSAKHKWLRMPPFGHDMYVGPEAKTVNIPSEVRPMRSDERIFEAIYEQNGKGKKITVQEWKEGLAAEWELEVN